MKIETFEDLVAWQEARRLTRQVYCITGKEGFGVDRDLARQMRRAAVSAMANIAEGFSRYTLRDSKQFFMTSRSSLAELRSHVYVAMDQEYLSPDDGAAARRLIETVGKLVSGLIRNTRKQLAVSERIVQTTIEPLSD